VDPRDHILGDRESAHKVRQGGGGFATNHTHTYKINTRPKIDATTNQSTHVIATSRGLSEPQLVLSNLLLTGSLTVVR
jgi:hypothetical protein